MLNIMNDKIANNEVQVHFIYITDLRKSTTNQFVSAVTQ